MHPSEQTIDERARVFWKMTGRRGDWQAFRQDAAASLVGEDDFLDEELAAQGDDAC